MASSWKAGLLSRVQSSAANLARDTHWPSDAYEPIARKVFVAATAVGSAIPALVALSSPWVGSHNVLGSVGLVSFAAVGGGLVASAAGAFGATAVVDAIHWAACKVERWGQGSEPAALDLRGFRSSRQNASLEGLADPAQKPGASRR